MKNENLNNNLNVKKISNRTFYNNNNNIYNYNHKTSTSFYKKKSPILSPFVSSIITDNNRNNKTFNNFNKNKINSKKNIKRSKSIKNLNSSKISKTPSKIMKSVRTIEYNPTTSLQMLNLLKNDSKYETYFNDEMNKYIKKNKIQKIKNKKDINFVGKEKIQDKYNLYFNCFIPDLYEEQKEKLLNEKKFLKMKKSKSINKLDVLEDDIGPNLYNENIYIPDIGYIAYKTNKKINSNYSLNSINTLNSNNRGYHKNNNNNFEIQNNYLNSNNNMNTINNPNLFNNQFDCLNIGQFNINKNTNTQLGNNFNNKDSSNFYRNKDINYNENLYNTNSKYLNENLNNELIKERMYKEIYNKAFKNFIYKPNSYFQDYSKQHIKWYFNQ